jgi:hypothetical protein
MSAAQIESVCEYRGTASLQRNLITSGVVSVAGVGTLDTNDLVGTHHYFTLGQLVGPNEKMEVIKVPARDSTATTGWAHGYLAGTLGLETLSYEPALTALVHGPLQIETFSIDVSDRSNEQFSAVLTARTLGFISPADFVIAGPSGMRSATLLSLYSGFVIEGDGSFVAGACPHRDFRPSDAPISALLDGYQEYAVSGWDGYNARAILPETLAAARSLVALLPQSVSRPSVAPGADGTIGFEWRYQSGHLRKLFIDVGPSEVVLAYVEPFVGQPRTRRWDSVSNVTVEEINNLFGNELLEQAIWMIAVAGDRACDSDRWVRVITMATYLNQDGTIHHQALKAAPPLPQDQRRWNHEVSGRLLSLTSDLDGEAISFVASVRQSQRAILNPLPKAFGFYGHVAGTAEAIREIDPKRTDVVYTPMLPPEPVIDPAHADVTFCDTTDSDVLALCSQLQGRVSVFVPTQTSELEQLRVDCTSTSSSSTALP